MFSGSRRSQVGRPGAVVVTTCCARPHSFEFDLRALRGFLPKTERILWQDENSATLDGWVSERVAFKTTMEFYVTRKGILNDTTGKENFRFLLYLEWG